MPPGCERTMDASRLFMGYHIGNTQRSVVGDFHRAAAPLALRVWIERVHPVPEFPAARSRPDDVRPNPADLQGRAGPRDGRRHDEPARTEPDELRHPLLR